MIRSQALSNCALARLVHDYHLRGVLCDRVRELGVRDVTGENAETIVMSQDVQQATTDHGVKAS